MTVQKDRIAIVGEKALDFTLPDIDGRDASLSGFRGKKVVVFVWASW